MKTAIIIGASSGIGKELAITLAKNGYQVGLMARRRELLRELQQKIPSNAQIEQMDISQIPEAIDKMEKMIELLGGKVNLIVINAAIGFLNPELDWSKEKQTIDVNVSGFCAIAGSAYKYFKEQGEGHIVGISSIGSLRGNNIAPAYNASKAFMSNYLEGLRKKAFQAQLPIFVTDIQPGFVDTEMARGEGKFWVAAPAKAAQQIFDTIQHRKTHAYITRRWRLIAWLLKLMPERLYFKI